MKKELVLALVVGLVATGALMASTFATLEGKEMVKA